MLHVKVLNATSIFNHVSAWQTINDALLVVVVKRVLVVYSVNHTTVVIMNIVRFAYVKNVILL